MVSSDDRAVGARRARIRPRRVKMQRDDGGGEHFEEAFDPQVHEPPAPVLDHRVVRVLAPGERGRVEAADAGRRQEHHRDQAARFRRLASAPATARGRAATAQNSRPTNSRICQTRPMLVNSRPWLPSQKLKSTPLVLQRAEPAGGGRADDDRRSAPRTARRRRASATSARGPTSSGAMYRPVASQAVAIQNTPNCVWTVRLTTYGRISRERKAEERTGLRPHSAR